VIGALVVESAGATIVFEGMQGDETVVVEEG
jgi:hypothetical protein